MSVVVRMLSSSPASSCVRVNLCICFPISNLKAKSNVIAELVWLLLTPRLAWNLSSLLPPLVPAVDNNVCVLMILTGLGFALT